MIFAAGYGTRLKPLSLYRPKALVYYNGKPLLEHVLLKLINAGFGRIIINVHYFAEQIIRFVEQKNFPAQIIFSYEQDQLLETGGGLFFAKKHFLNQPLLIHNVDIISDLDLNTFYDSFQNNMLALLAVQKRTSSRVLVFDEKEKFLCAWKNHKTEQIIQARSCKFPAEFAFSGIHVVSPKLLDLLWPGKYSITEAYLKLAANYKISYFDHTPDKWKDVGSLKSLISK